MLELFAELERGLDVVGGEGLEHAAEAHENETEAVGGGHAVAPGAVEPA